MHASTKKKLTESIKANSAFLKEMEDRLEKTKRRKKEIEDEARERRNSVSS